MYDRIGRLKSATNSVRNENYNYDQNGNRTTRNTSGPSGKDNRSYTTGNNANANRITNDGQ